MDGGTGAAAAEVLSPGEAEWPPELRLPPPPPPPEPAPPPPTPTPPPPPPLPQPGPFLRPPPWLQPLVAAAVPSKEPPQHRHVEGFDDQHFLGSIMESAAPHQQPAAATAEGAPVVVKRKRGRPPKNRDGAAATPAPAKPVKKKEDEEEVVCFICFDGGNLVVCDRRGCPKVYHPACIKRDESFFRSRGKWNCGWHICSSCEKAGHYMCYTCTYSLCKRCIKQGKFFGVRGNKGFCDTCYGTILLIESKDEDGTKVSVDFDDKNSWEYLFKLYWLDLKGKHLLTLEELISAKSRWTVQSTSARREKEDSSDELYDANNDHDASSDGFSRKRKQSNPSRKRGRKRQKDGGMTTTKCEISIKGAESLPKRVPSEGFTLVGDMNWASPELLGFIGHMRNGDKSYISQFDVQVLLLEYIKQNNLRDPRRKSQIICDDRLSNLFQKPRVGHFEMLKLLEMHFHVKETSVVNGDSQKTLDPEPAQADGEGYDEMATKLCSDKRKKTHKKTERESQANLEDYAAIDMHNINLIYLRRSLMEDLIDAAAVFSDRITGAFVRIRISGVGQKQDMYRLVKVLGTHRVAERYSVGKKTTDYALEILNLDKKEIITMDTISNQDFTEEECKRLRQSMKCGIVTRLKVGDLQNKAKIFQSLRVNDWLENEKQKLSHLRDRASETGRRKELRECVEKLQLLNTPEERARRINEVPEVHVDPHMSPNYESAEEQNDKNDVDWSISRNRPNDLLFPGRKGTEPKSMQNHIHTQKFMDATSSGPATEGVTHRPGVGSRPSDSSLQSINGWNIPQPSINLNSTVGEAASASVSSSGAVSGDTEPEKVWHYKDPSGNVQGPFTLSQLSKWASYFPRNLRIWLTFESEDNSLLLSEVLSKQQKDFIEPMPVMNSNKSTWAGTGQDRSNSSMADNNSSSPIGYNMVYSSGLSGQSTKCSAKPGEEPKILGGTLPPRSWEHLKDAHTLHDQRAQHQGNYSHAIPSSAVSHGPSGSHDLASKEKISEQNDRQDSGHMWSPTKPHTNSSCQSNVKPHLDNRDEKQPQNVNASEKHPLAGSVGNLNTQMDPVSQKVPVPTPQQSEQLLGCKTSLQQEGSSNSITNPASHDELQLSIASARSERCSRTNPVEGRDFSSASGVSSQLGVPSCSPQSAPSMCTSNSSKAEEIMNRHKTCDFDLSNAPVNEPPEHKLGPVSLDTQHLEHKYPGPTSKLERKEPSMKQSGSIPVALMDSTAKNHSHSAIAFVSGTSSPPTGKTVSLQSLKETSRLERDLKDGGPITQTKQFKEETAAVERKNAVVNPICDAEAIAVSDVLESITQQNCGAYNVHGATSLENFTQASAEEEQPQCSSPIALSPWGEPNYYQGEAVDSALWGVQDDPSNDMWSLSSPTPALQPSSGLQADGKDASCMIQEVIGVQGNSATIVVPPMLEDKKMERGNPSASTGCKVLEQKKPKPSAASGSSLEGCAKSSGLQLPGSSLEGSTKASGCQRPGSSQEGSTKLPELQLPGSSIEGSTKASGWQRSSSSPEGGTKASAWQQASSSPVRCRKTSGWHSSARESSKVNSTSNANQNRNSSGSHQTTTHATKYSSEAPRRHGNTNSNTAGWGEALGISSASHQTTIHATKYSSEAPRSHGNANSNTSGWGEAPGNSSPGHQTMTQITKYSSEAPRRHGNTNSNTAGWGEALGHNKSWHPSSGNAGRSSQSSRHHDRHPHQSSESWRGSSNHSRRSDHRQGPDHGSGGSSRSSSRGQSQRGICKFYESSGYCRRGSSCNYLHR